MQRTRSTLLATTGLFALVVGVQAIPVATEGDASTALSSTPDASLATRTGIGAPQAQVETAAATYRAGELMVTLASDVPVARIAARYGLEVQRDANAAGIAVFSTEAGQELSAMAILRADPDVAGVARNAAIWGAGKNKANTVETTTVAEEDLSDLALDGETEAPDLPAPDADRDPSTETAPPADILESAADHQWHHALVHESDRQLDLNAVIVAVLDTGVAYTNHVGSDGTVHMAAPTLESSAIVAPWDFVDNDALPLDHHQHGTHIASVIASSGAVRGIAPGVTLMPLRVLDAHNRGTEADLIAAIHYAADNGAQVMNMSLSFGPGYQPSQALQLALQHAAKLGVIMVSATGNAGKDYVSWPAASPLVLAVGGAAPKAGYQSAGTIKDYFNVAERAPYSNGNAAVDLMAPGGNLDQDNTGDGYPDGILAETIGLNDPGTMGLWLYAGTSQAAAIVSGQAARLVAMGADAEATLSALQSSAQSYNLDGPYNGVGRGYLDGARAESQVETDHFALHVGREIGAAMLPYLERGEDGRVRPAARVTVQGVVGSGTGMWVYATIENGGEPLTAGCFAEPTTGQCVVKGDWTEATDSKGESIAQAWTVRVDAVVYAAEQVFIRPHNVFYATDALALMLDAAEASGQLPENYGLAVHWSEGLDLSVGDLAESTVIINSGTGLASSPLGIILTPGALDPARAITLDGTGLASSPLGFSTLSHTPLAIDLDGSGLASSPLGFGPLGTAPLSSFGTGLASSPLGIIQLGLATVELDAGDMANLLILDGTGLASSPLGFHADDLMEPGGGGVNLSTLPFEGGAQINGTGLGGDIFEDTHLDEVLSNGGFRSATGAEPAMMLAVAGQGGMAQMLGASNDAMPVTGSTCVLDADHDGQIGPSEATAARDCRTLAGGGGPTLPR